MRDLDARDVITGDFLLVHGDLVSNLPIDSALTTHRARRTADKNAIMTMILRDGGLGDHRTKAHGIIPVFVLDSRKNRCLHYEEMHLLQSHKYINIDPELINDHSEMEIRTDLIDCGIDICTPDVLALWAESFDYEVPRKHFLHGVLKDYELNGKTIHTEIVSDHYAARVSNLQAYDAVSKDVLGRWTYPLVPDSNLVAGQTYRFGKGGVCKENGVIMARNCRIGKRTVVGRETSVGDGSILRNSVVGKRCHIGKNVTISNAYIWDDVVIGDGSVVERAIVANEAAVGKNCRIQPGALLSFGVRIADGMEIAEGTRISKASMESGEQPPSDPSIVGTTGLGYAYTTDSNEDDETTLLQSSLVYSLSHLNISTESISTITSTPSDTSPSVPRSRLSSFTSVSSDDANTSHNHNESFHRDAVQGIFDTLRESGDFDSAKLEFMGLRLSNDATDSQIRRAIATAFCKRIMQMVEKEGIQAADAVTKTLATRGSVKFLKEVATAGEVEGMREFLGWCLRDLEGRNTGRDAGTVLYVFVQGLYQREVVDEDAVLGWWTELEEKKSKGEEKEETARVRETVGRFVEWLRSAEEESSEDDSD